MGADADELMIAVRDATVVRGGNAVLRDANWMVRKGENWFVLGKNGCGKSTLMGLVMATLWCRRGGSVTVLGKRFGTVDTREIRKMIGWIGAELIHRTKDKAEPLNVVLSGFDASIGLYRDPEKAEVKRARAKMAELEIEHLAERAFGTLSSGERMRVLIARATMHNPQILVLDEPCSHLDLPVREEFLAFLADLESRPGAPTIIQVTHRIDDVSALFTHGLVMRDGEILASGPRQEVLTDAVLSAAYDLPVKLHHVGDRVWPSVIPHAK